MRRYFNVIEEIKFIEVYVNAGVNVNKIFWGTCKEISKIELDFSGAAGNSNKVATVLF